MSFISEALDVLEHLVVTHPTFNMSMSQDEALAKVAAARAADLAHEAAHGVEHPAELGNAVAQIREDLAALKSVVEGLVNPFAPTPTTPSTDVAVPPIPVASPDLPGSTNVDPAASTNVAPVNFSGPVIP